MIDHAVVGPERSTHTNSNSLCNTFKKTLGRSTPWWIASKKNAKAPESIHLETAGQTSWPAVEAREKVLKIIARAS